MVNYSKTKDVKNNIMNSAHKLFSQHGYNNVKVIDIAKDADVAKGLVFYHFTSKEELVNQLLYRHSCEIFSMLMNLDKRLSPDIMLYQIFDSMFNPKGSPNICNGYFERGIPDKHHMAVDRARQDTVLPVMLQLVLDGIDKGLFAITEPELSFEIMSMGFNNFLHNNTAKFSNPEYHKQFLRSAQYLLNSTLKPKNIDFCFQRNNIITESKV